MVDLLASKEKNMRNAKQTSAMAWKLVRVSVQSNYTTSNPPPSCFNTTDNCGQLATQPRPAVVKSKNGLTMGLLRSQLQCSL